jgi:hypothetical protein
LDSQKFVSCWNIKACYLLLSRFLVLKCAFEPLINGEQTLLIPIINSILFSSTCIYLERYLIDSKLQLVKILSNLNSLFSIFFFVSLDIFNNFWIEHAQILSQVIIQKLQFLQLRLHRFLKQRKFSFACFHLNFLA